MTRPNEIAALAAKLRRADVKRYPWLSFCIEVADDLDRLSATSPGDAVRENWIALGDDISWLDGRDVVLLVRGMEVSARYCKGEWSDDTPISPREYSGAVWSCFDDEFQLEIEECSHDPKQWGHDGATHWRVPLAPAEIDESQRFYGAQCRSYPNCTGGCGLGCTHEMNAATPTPPSADVQAALQGMVRLFDEQGNMTADFKTMQDAINYAYAALFGVRA